MTGQDGEGETSSDRYVAVGPVKPDADGNVGDVCMQITSRFSGRCANCGKPYLEGALIGYSDEAGGWVGSCCMRLDRIERVGAVPDDAKEAL